MKNFFEKIKSKNLQDLSRDALLYKVMPHFLMDIAHNYFRVDVEGLENVPKKGGGIITPNHSGFLGFDAMLLGHEIHQYLKRVPRVLTHHLWFMTPMTAIPAEKLGFHEATTENGLKFLKKKNLIILFPEGEYGNFKPSSKAYRLQEFRRGFVRMAIQTKTPIIPTVIIGAEETHINLGQLKLTKYLKGTILPLPLNVLPLPAKWKIKFLEPIFLPYKPSAIKDSELMREVAFDIQDKMQRRIQEEISKRKTVF